MDNLLSELSLAITKVSVDKAEGGVMRWRAVASDVFPDLYTEKMSSELFDDFVGRIETKSQVPEPFNKILDEGWTGGMPYISISHYKSGTGSKNVPGMPEKIYRDGDRLKAVGTLHDNPLGHAVFKSLCEDLYTEKAKDVGKIRISIGFLDLEHKHLGEGTSPDFLFTRSNLTDSCPMCQEGIGNKVYIKGQLVHLALTRVPVNPRTDMEVDKAMGIKTKLDDAESIVGKELSETLEEKSLVQSDAIVIKADSESIEEKAKKVVDPDESSEGEVGFTDNPAEEAAEMKKKKDAMMGKAKIAADKQSEELTYDEPDEEKREQRRNRPAGERSMLENSFESLEAKIVEMKSQGVPAETALREIQPLFSAFGEQVKKSFDVPTPSTEASSELSVLTAAVKSLAESMSTFQQSVSTDIATLRAQVVTKATQNLNAPEPRSIAAGVVRSMPAQQRDPNVPLSIQEIAMRSTQQ